MRGEGRQTGSTCTPFFDNQQHRHEDVLRKRTTTDQSVPYDTCVYGRFLVPREHSKNTAETEHSLSVDHTRWGPRPRSSSKIGRPSVSDSRPPSGERIQ